jgi:glycerol-3-phosphate acyltransferase PlsY
MAGPTLAKKQGQNGTVQVLAGLAALAAHNWSPFLRFTGGRGVAHAIGFMLAVSRPALAAFVSLSLIGVMRRQVPQFVGLGIVAAPLAALVRRQPREIVAGMVGMAAIILTKRLLTNEPSLPADGDRRRVLLSRLLYDRDTFERETWVRQDLE